MKAGDYEIDILVQGFPGKTVCHGGLGWSTVALLRGHGHNILVDVGPFNMRRLIAHQLAERGLQTSDITDVLLSHAHYDHMINWVMFPEARVVLSRPEFEWAAALPMGHGLVPELYVRELKDSPRLWTVEDGEEVAPHIRAYVVPGHTPGSLVYVAEGSERDIVFTGDAAKNRAELITSQADLTMDAVASSRSIDRIRAFWSKRPGSVAVPGHDVPMILQNGKPRFIAGRRAGLTAFFGENLETTTLYELRAAEHENIRSPAPDGFHNG